MGQFNQEAAAAASAQLSQVAEQGKILLGTHRGQATALDNPVGIAAISYNFV